LIPRTFKAAAALAATVMAFSSLPASAVTNVYRVAHTRYQNSDMVVVIIDQRFFGGSRDDQARWFTAIEQCVRSVRLGGQTVVVSGHGGRFQFYAPNSWHSFLRTVDMNWVQARVNKQLTCNF
jgi:threonine dehydrogenase-like Zn-dependent dehydrogenase